MKRYMALIRIILEYVECHGDTEYLSPPEVKGYTPDQVWYHIDLCQQAEYIKPRKGRPQNLTWAGHNALDQMRENGR